MYICKKYVYMNKDVELPTAFYYLIPAIETLK